MAIDPKLVSIISASDLPTGDPTSAGEFFFFEGNEMQKAPMTNIYNQVTSGITGEATQSNAPGSVGFERWVVATPLTLPNSWGFEVTQAELDDNDVFFNVTDGVVSKELSLKPTPPVIGIVEENNTDAVSGGEVWNSQKPVRDISSISPQLSDNSLMQLGVYDAVTGNASESTNSKRMPSIVITSEMVGQNTISGIGAVASAHGVVIVKSSSGTVLLSIAGQGSATPSEITFEITSAMIGEDLKFTVGIISGFEPSDGYENHFMWNKGTEALPFSKFGSYIVDAEKLPAVQTVKKNNVAVENPVSGVAVENYINDLGLVSEINTNGEIVRAKEKTTYIPVSGNEFGDNTGFYVYNTGGLPGSLNGWKRKLFEIDGQSTYCITGIVYSSINVAGAVYFDEGMNYLGYSDRLYPNGDSVFNRKEISYPANTKYVGTCNRNTDDYVVLERIESSGEYDKALFDKDLTITNEKVVKILGHDLASATNRMVIDNIEAFGDSTTQGADLPNMIDDRWTTLLQEKIGIPVTNYGFSGARAEEITFWQGGITVDATLSNPIVPANGTRISVSYTGSFNPFRASTVPSLDVYMILQNGDMVSGNLNRTTGFMQDGSQAIDTGNGLIRFCAKNLKAHTELNKLMIVSFGANNTTLINNSEQTVDDLMKWYSDFASQHPNCLIWSQNIRSSGELAICLAVEDYLEKQFGTRFCNMRKYLASEKALEDATIIQPGFVSTTDDITAVNAGLIPPSFKFVASSAHVNELGHKLQCNYLFTHINLYYL